MYLPLVSLPLPLLLRPAGLLLLWLAIVAVLPARAVAQHPVDFSLAYLQERTKFVGSGTDPYFMLRGADLELSYGLHDRLGLAVAAAGLSTVNLRGSLDVEQVSLTAGPRYTWNWGRITPTVTTRRGGIFAEARAGYVFATSGAYPVQGRVQNQAAALTYLGGGGLNVHVNERFDLRLLQASYVRSQLPNGGTNRQNSIRLGAGINWHFGL